MDRERAWVIPVVAGLVMLGAMFFTLGGLSGLISHPGNSLAGLALVLVIEAPIVWLGYREMRRYPIIVPVADLSPVSNAARLSEREPIFLIASRWKILGWIVANLAYGTILIGIGFMQTGVCRVVSIGIIGPFILWNLGLWMVCLAVPNRLILGPDGLTHSMPWAARQWTWDEVRSIRLVKWSMSGPLALWIFKGRPTMSIAFKRYQPKDHRSGPPQAGFRSVFRVSGEEVAALLDTARSQWSSTRGTTYVPVKGTFRAYFRTAIVLVIGLGIGWMWYVRPCGQ